MVRVVSGWQRGTGGVRNDDAAPVPPRKRPSKPARKPAAPVSDGPEAA